MAQGIITTQKVKVCSFTGDPGCLGYPAWIDHPACDCIYDEVDFQFCDCGGSDVYGEMWHEEDCPAAEQNAHPTLGESATSQAVTNAETLSTSDGVPPSAPARVA